MYTQTESLLNRLFECVEVVGKGRATGYVPTPTYIFRVRRITIGIETVKIATLGRDNMLF